MGAQRDSIANERRSWAEALPRGGASEREAYNLSSRRIVGKGSGDIFCNNGPTASIMTLPEIWGRPRFECENDNVQSTKTHTRLKVSVPKKRMRCGYVEPGQVGQCVTGGEQRSYMGAK